MDVIQAVRNEGPDALRNAAGVGDVPELRKLLWAMVNTEARHYEVGLTSMGMTPLMLAARGGHAECTQMLIEGGSDVTATSHGIGQHTALMLAAAGGHAECTQMLIEAGSDLTVTERPSRMTALIIAAVRGQAECTQMLIEAGSDLTAADRCDRRALEFPYGNYSKSGPTGVRTPDVRAFLKEAEEAVRKAAS